MRVEKARGVGSVGLLVLGTLATSCVGGAAGGGTELPVDCRNNDSRPVTESDIHCAPYSGDTRTVGTGPAFGDTFGDGFMDGTHVVFANRNALADYTAIFSLNPATQVRTVISGTYNDPRTGLTMVGTGPTISDVYDAARGSDGRYYFLVSDSDHPTGTWAGLLHDPVVIRIDPATGNRTEVVDFGTDANACMTRGGKRLYPNGALVVSSTHSDFLTMDVGSDGTIYAGVEGSEGGGVHNWGGIAAFSGGHCRLISVDDSMNADDVGTGYQMTDAPAGIRLSGNTLYVIPSDTALMAIDLATGNRTIVSNDVSSVGSGPPVHTQYIQLAPDGMLWTAGGDVSEALLVGIDPATGNRIGADSHGSGSTHTGRPLYGVDPTHPWIYFSDDADRIGVIEYTTGNYNILAL